jgi:hypothetical protein
MGLRGRRRPLAAGRAPPLAGERLERAGGEAFARGPLGIAQDLGRILEAEQWPCLTRGQLPGAQEILDFRRELEQPQRVGDGRPRPAHTLGDLLVGEPEALLEGAVGLGLFDRVEVGALEVLDQRELEQLAVVLDLPDHDGDDREPGALRGPPPSLPGDDRVSACTGWGYDDGLDHALSPDRGRELLEPGVVEGDARLEPVGVELRDGQAAHPFLGRQESGEPAPETSFPVGHDSRPRSSRARAR